MEAIRNIHISEKLEGLLDEMLNSIAQYAEELQFCKLREFPDLVRLSANDAVLMASDPEQFVSDCRADVNYKNANEEIRIGYDRALFFKTALVYTIKAKIATNDGDCWELFASAKAFFGLFEGSIMHPTSAAVRKDTARKAAKASHEEVAQMFKEAECLLDANFASYASKAEAARALMVHFPIKLRTAESWVKRWHMRKQTPRIPKVLILLA